MAARCPHDRDELTRLPGVGRKTANVVLNMAFGQPTMAVDTHIFRIGNRLKLAPGKTPDQVEDKLVRIIPEPLSAPRASLADPAWALCLQGAQAGLPGLRDRRHLQGAGEMGRRAGAAGPIAPLEAAG
jgi:adenine-specific DNA glycosylase